MKPPVLVFGWGNPSRGDDGLGAAFIGEATRRNHVELMVDYQLHPEHALDLVGRVEVLFVDASVSGPEPFLVVELEPVHHPTISTHRLSPAALLAVFRRVTGTAPPKARLLSIRGWHFDLGERLSDRARFNLEAALAWWREEVHATLPSA